MEVTALRSSVPRCSFLHKEPDLAFLGRWGSHELSDGIKHDLELSIVPFFERFQLASQLLVSRDHFP